MLKIAVVDDEAAMAEELTSYLERFERENGEQFKVTAFRDGLDFLSAGPDWDIVLMDIEMPHLSGMEAAKRLRDLGSKSILIFITNMAQYAIKGYEVEASDFVVKPVSYYPFSFKLQKAVAAASRQQRARLMLGTKSGARQLNIADIYYLEIDRHRLFYHTEEGTIETWDSLTHARELLEPHGFALCNACYLVNLDHVTQIQDDVAWVGGDQLKISRAKKKEFMNALTLAFGGIK